jgi:hypothetical protein
VTAAVRNEAVVRIRMGAASTYRPFGIVHSMAWLVSLVASAKNSALPASPEDGTSDTGLASHSDNRRSVRSFGPATMLPFRKGDDWLVAAVRRGGAEELGAATCSQDPSRALIADAPSSVTRNAVSFHPGCVNQRYAGAGC